MKELSIEEKAKRYDEAFERAKNFIENGDERERTIAESIFAGIMEESDDERIRKAIINIFATHKDYEIFFGASVKDIITWLEKQGEIFPILSSSFNIGKNWKEPVSEDLEKEIENFSDYSNLLAPQREIEIIAHHFANWQKQQMMKDAVEAEITKISPNDHLRVVSDVLPLKDESEWGTKVKLIIIKQEEE